MNRSGDKMGIVAMILGIISLVPLLMLLIPLPLLLPVPLSGIVPIFATGLSVSVVGLILGIVARVKSKPHKRMAVAGIIMCSLGIIASAISLLIVVAGEPDRDWDPFWSPDGSRIVFQSDRDGEEDEIYVMDADGSNQQRLSNYPIVEEDTSSSP